MIVESLKYCLIQTLAYYDVFFYPLTFSEITAKLTVKSRPSEIQLALEELEKEDIIFKFDEFYSLRNDYSLIEKRRTANARALEQMELARKKAAFISRFPFIRGIFVSGSLSKNYADDKSDLDFFVVTSPNRLWLARTFFVMARKILIAKKNYKHYCLNYFIASNHLSIEERNIFTATELATLIPVYGHSYYHQLLMANPWLGEWLPNFQWGPQPIEEDKPSRLKSALEWLLRVITTKRTEQWLMNLTLFKLRRQHESKFSKEDFAVAFKAREYVSKVHIGHNQKRILDLYEKRLKDFQPHFNLATA